MGIQRKEYKNIIALKDTYDGWYDDIVRISQFENKQKRYAIWLLQRWLLILYMTGGKILSLKNDDMRKRFLKQRSMCVEETIKAIEYTFDWDEYSE